MKKVTTMFLALFLCLSVASAAIAAVTVVPQSALTPSTSYYTNDLGTALIMTGGGNSANVGSSRNDDGFSGPINLGFTLHFYGNDYTQFWANNNGNISFTGGIAAYTPSGPQGQNVPIISPFFADVDTRNLASGLMSINNSVANQIIITWDQVGYYSVNADKLNSFQLVLRGDDYDVPAGEGNIGFFWKTMDWETGDASGGSGGFGGTPAAVGFGVGDGVNGQILQGSTLNGISDIVENHKIWFFSRSGDDGGPDVVDHVPEPATMLLLGLGIVGLAGARRKFKA